MSLPPPPSAPSPHATYPPDAYHGEGGEVSAWIRPSGTPADLALRGGGTCEYLATGAQTDRGTLRLRGTRLDRDLSGDGRNDLLAVTGGASVTGTWAKGGVNEPFVLRTGAGEDLLLAPGTTWVELPAPSAGVAVG